MKGSGKIRSNSIRFNKDKLRKEFIKRGIYQTKFSEDAGFSETWAGNVLSSGIATGAFVKALERYGMNIQDFIDKPEEPETAPAPVVEDDGVLRVRNMSRDELYETIFKAVLDALKA